MLFSLRRFGSLEKILNSKMVGKVQSLLVQRPDGKLVLSMSRVAGATSVQKQRKRKVVTLKDLCAIYIARACGRGRHRASSKLAEILPKQVVQLITPYVLLNRVEHDIWFWVVLYGASKEEKRSPGWKKTHKVLDFYHRLPHDVFEVFYHEITSHIEEMFEDPDPHIWN